MSMSMLSTPNTINLSTYPGRSSIRSAEQIEAANLAAAQAEADRLATELTAAGFRTCRVTAERTGKGSGATSRATARARALLGEYGNVSQRLAGIDGQLAVGRFADEVGRARAQAERVKLAARLFDIAAELVTQGWKR